MNAAHTTGRAAAKPVCSALCLALCVALYAAAPTVQAQAAGQAQTVQQFDIPAGPLSRALGAWGTQSDKQLVFAPDLVAGKTSKAVSGRHDAGEALTRLLQGTGVAWEVKGGTYLLKAAPKPVEHPAPKPRATPAPQEEEAALTNMPAIMVTGTKTLNMDIMRTEDDPQPYVVFDREEIETSGATNLDEFFKSQLAMNVNGLTSSQWATSRNIKSLVNLRGLGSDETLILIDGRRMAGFSADGFPGQPDINGIPLAAIERIEILPTTASGIYGGGATGGAINIVLRRDYTGIETKFTYGNSFESDVSSRRIDANAGFNFGGGRTSVILSGSFASTNPLLARERDLLQRGREHILLNDPSFYLDASTPPLGATTNIRSVPVNGVRPTLTLDDGTSLNSTVAHVPYGYPGAITDGGTALTSTAGSYNLALADTAQEDGGGNRGLIKTPKTKSLMLTMRHEFTPRLHGFLELYASNVTSTVAFSGAQSNDSSLNGIIIPADAPSNPFQQAVIVTVPALGADGYSTSESKDRKVTAGLILELHKEWKASLDFTWDRYSNSSSRPGGITSTTRAGVADGSIDVFRDINVFPIVFEIDPEPYDVRPPAYVTLKSSSLRIAGSLPWVLPAGKPTITTLIEHRDELFDDILTTRTNGQDTQALRPHKSQSVASLYLEAGIPIVSEDNNVSGIESLDVQVAVRRDEYKVNGASGIVDPGLPAPIARETRSVTSTDPTLALKYTPIAGLMFRASYGTGFLPPNVSQLTPNEPIPIRASFLTDPLRGGEQLGEIQLITGGNPNLMPERSKSWSAGMVVAPDGIDGLRVSVDWSRIKKNDNIFLPLLNIQSQLNLAITAFPQRIIRAAPTDGYDVGPIIGLNNTPINLSRLTMEAIDFGIDYEFRTVSYGDFSFSLNGTRMITLKTLAIPGLAETENVGLLSGFDTVGGLKWRANATAMWTYRDWSLGWRARYFDSYFLNADHAVVPRQGRASVASQTYHDVFFTYNVQSSDVLSGHLNNTEIGFGINNVLNTAPPIDTQFPQLTYSAIGDPRLASYYFSISKRFGK